MKNSEFIFEFEIGNGYAQRDKIVLYLKHYVVVLVIFVL